MGRKKETPEQKYLEACKSLEDSWKRWLFLKKEGGSDPTWSDGANMHLVRNHILYHLGEIMNLSNEYGFPIPNLFYNELPPEMPDNYMANPDTIRKRAKEVYQIYMNNKDYQYMLQNRKKITYKKIANNMALDNILNYVVGLRIAIEQDDLITMRRHRNPESQYGYLNSFKSGAQKMKDYFKQEE